MTQPPSGGYPPPNPGSEHQQQSGPPAPSGGYPPPAPAGPGSEPATGPTATTGESTGSGQRGPSGSGPAGSQGASYPPPGGYPPPAQGGYPPPPQQGSYPSQQQQGGYPGQQQGGFPGRQQGGYPPPPQQGSYPAQQQGGSQGSTPAGYPPAQQGGYGPPQGGYPPPMQSGYPQVGSGYPPAPGGSGGAPARPALDVSKVSRNDWIVMGTGVLLFIFSFFGWVSFSYDSDFLSGSGSLGAWHEYWWLATVLGLAVAAVVAARTLAGQAIAGIKPVYLVAAAGAGALITLIALIEIFAKTSGSTYASFGPGFGVWACLVLALVQTYFVWMWAQKQPGNKLPTLPGPTG